MRMIKVIGALAALAVGIGGGYYVCQHYYNDDPQADAEQAFSDMATKSTDAENKYTEYLSEYTPSETVYEDLMQDFSYEIMSTETDGAAGVCTVKITNRDMNAFYRQYISKASLYVVDQARKQEAFNAEEVKEHLEGMELEMLSSWEGDMTTEEMQADLVRNGSSWELVLDEDDVDLLLGHYISARENAVTSLGEMSEDNIEDFASEFDVAVDQSVNTLHEAAWFLADTVWNKVLCDVVSCIDAGTDQDGNDYDLQAGMETLDQLADDCKIYDSQVDGLDQETCQEAIEAWDQASAAFEALVSDIKAADPDSEDYDYSPDTGDFTKAMNAFIALAYKDGE